MSLQALNGTYGTLVNFYIEYKWQSCGGVLHGPYHTVSAPKNLQYPINCVWHIDYPNNGEVVGMTFTKMNLKDCDKAYITVR